MYNLFNYFLLCEVTDCCYFKPVDFKNKLQKSIHDEIVHLVETMLQLQKEKKQTTLPDKLDQLNTRIEYTDEKINKLLSCMDWGRRRGGLRRRMKNQERTF